MRLRDSMKNDLKQSPFKRGHGILLPIFSLPGDFGIGGFSKAAYDFVDFISLAGGDMWQILPLGPTGFGDSPYQCFSAFAGNIYFIDPEWLYEKGWLARDDLPALRTKNTGKIDYGKLYKTRKFYLKKAYFKFKKSATQKDLAEYNSFLKKSKFWLEDYALFLVLKENEFPFGRIGIKTKENEKFAYENFKEEIEIIKFLEFVFFTQWKNLKKYANQKGIKMVGDIPLYVADDSADVWGHPELFMLKEDYTPSKVAGVPPDDFSKNGQLWGNPLYNWEVHKQTNFNWWKERIKWQAELYDVIRIDHFLGICRYYSIDAGHSDAKNGEWKFGPGKKLTDVLIKDFPNLKFIAEDLGFVWEEVAQLLKSTGFPGMKLLQFGFKGDENALLHKIPENCVVYPGTHDNPTLMEFFGVPDSSQTNFAKEYLSGEDDSSLTEKTVKECFKSAANTVIIPLQDYLELGKSARINTPSTKFGNWQWRLENMPSLLVAEKIKKYSEIYKRER